MSVSCPVRTAVELNSQAHWGPQFSTYVVLQVVALRLLWEVKSWSVAERYMASVTLL